MDYHNVIENIESSRAGHLLCNACNRAIKTDSQYPIFGDSIWIRDIPEVVKLCREQSIKCVILNSTQTDIATVIKAMIKENCKLTSLIIETKIPVPFGSTELIEDGFLIQI